MITTKYGLFLSFFLAAVLALLPFAEAAAAPKAPKNKVLILATTTSTQDSGLLDVLLPEFEKASGYLVKAIAVGSGQAIAMGRKGEADVLLVHSPEDEEKLVADGFAIDREVVMHNDFLIVGPPADPAKIKGAASSAVAFGRIAAAKALFVSRGDKSGTHARELKIWQAAGVPAEGKKWYQQTGLGMGDTLNVASEKGGYTLTDRGTFLALNLNKRLALEPLLVGEPSLLNVYHVMKVNPARWPKVNAAGAKAFAAFLLSKPTQELISKFGADKYGSPLFYPDALPEPAAEPAPAAEPPKPAKAERGHRSRHAR